jgi:hypothetical protein
MGSFGYNWLNCKILELWGWIAKIETLVFELKNAVNFWEENCNFPLGLYLIKITIMNYT